MFKTNKPKHTKTTKLGVTGMMIRPMIFIFFRDRPPAAPARPDQVDSAKRAQSEAAARLSKLEAEKKAPGHVLSPWMP